MKLCTYIFLVSSGFSSESNNSYNDESYRLSESEKFSSIMIENMSQFLNINLKMMTYYKKSSISCKTYVKQIKI